MGCVHLLILFLHSFSLCLRLGMFRSSVVKAFSSSHSQSLPVTELTSQVNSDPSTQFSDAEVSVALEQMQEANQVMVSEGVVFLI